MPEAWINFGILLAIQLLILFAAAFYERNVAGVRSALYKGILIGVPFGLSFDLVLGKLLGLSTYALGFDLVFLVPNAALSYGIFAATILLFRKRRPLYFCITTLVVAASYEAANLFLHVWEWRLPVPAFLLPLVLAIGYVGGAVLVAMAGRERSP